MCGIGFSIRSIESHRSSSHAIDNDLSNPQFIDTCIRRAIFPRGPDVRGEIAIGFQDTDNGLKLELTFFGSVLHLRGKAVTSQPIRSTTSDSLLLWNGEIFDGLPIPPESNDGQILLETLENRFDLSISEMMAKIEGPYAFVYYDARSHMIWFGRDPLGRRSLMLINQVDNKAGGIYVASHFSGAAAVASSELATQNLFCIDLKSPLNILEVDRRYKRLILNQHCPLQSERFHIQDLKQDIPSPLLESARVLSSCLGDSVRRRVGEISTLCRSNDKDSRVAILFSGGLDCTTIALMAHSHIHPQESIDLINVAFENPRVIANSTSNDKYSKQDTFAVPDRLTAEGSWRELCKLCPQRTWKLVKVNVWMSEYLRHKQQIIELMRPNYTVMDLSIAAALFFAARGIGNYLLPSDPPRVDSQPMRSYRSPARVLLSGLGADELLGGYSRHRSAFFSPEPSSWERLVDELQLDIDRISTRNLGRDDRIIAHFGREVRYPFLDLNVVKTLSSLPVHHKCDLDLGRGLGDKLLLRVLANQLGLKDASKLEKRAIQFGARSAKLEGVAKGPTELFELLPPVSEKNLEEEQVFLRDSFQYRTHRPPVPTLDLIETLDETCADRQAGLCPSDLKLSELIFTSYPMGRTIILAHPSHLAIANRYASISGNVTSTNNKPLYMIEKVPGKGLGMLARELLVAGSTIYAERPVLILPERLEAPSQEILDKIHLIAFDQLSFENQREIANLSLSSQDPDSILPHRLVNKIWNNEICLDLCQDKLNSDQHYQYSAVFPMISRCNHSCSPNSRWHFDWSDFTLKLCALRTIRADEEITVSYIEHLCHRDERREKLSSKWGFTCACIACDQSSEFEQLQSDNRRIRLEIEEKFFTQTLAEFNLDSEPNATRELLERARRAVELVEEEGLIEEFSIFGRALAWYQNQSGDLELGALTAKKYMEVVGAVQGFESEAWKQMKKLSIGLKASDILV